MDYLRTILPATTEEEFFDYLSCVSTDNIVVYAVDEGTVVFPKVPLMRVEGPLAVVQLLETTLLNLVNYARFGESFVICHRYANVKFWLKEYLELKFYHIWVDLHEYYHFWVFKICHIVSSSQTAFSSLMLLIRQASPYKSNAVDIVVVSLVTFWIIS